MTTVTLICTAVLPEETQEYLGKYQGMITLNGDFLDLIYMFYVKRGLRNYYLQPETSPFLCTQMARPNKSFSVFIVHTWDEQ